MALATLAVTASSVIQTNDQTVQRFYGKLTISARTDDYPVGGMALDSVLQAALLPRSNQAPIRVMVWSSAGSGYVYQRIKSTGNLMVLQVPPNGSLTTAAPLQQLPSGGNSLSGVFADTIEFMAEYQRNT